MLNSSTLAFLLLATFHLLTHYSSAYAQDLTAVLCTPRLPTKRSSVASMYDGDDTIYVFGGHMNTVTVENSTLKYSISEDTLVETAEPFPFSPTGGALIKNKLGNVYYLIGTSKDGHYAEDIFQYFPQNETFTNVSRLHTTASNFAVITTDEDTALIIGGARAPNIIQRLNLNTLQSEVLSAYPKDRVPDQYYTTAIFLEEKNVVYLFDGLHYFPNVTKWDLTTNRFRFLPNYFPRMWGSPDAVWDGRFGYILGGFAGDGAIPGDGILQFDPETEDVKFIRVDGYPGWSGFEFASTSAVYVEKLNRIYMFGGYTANYYGFRDEIWYISLDPLGS